MATDKCVYEELHAPDELQIQNSFKTSSHRTSQPFLAIEKHRTSNGRLTNEAQPIGASPVVCPPAAVETLP